MVGLGTRLAPKDAPMVVLAVPSHGRLACDVYKLTMGVSLTYVTDDLHEVVIVSAD